MAKALATNLTKINKELTCQLQKLVQRLCKNSLELPIQIKKWRLYIISFTKIQTKQSSNKKFDYVMTLANTTPKSSLLYV